MDHETGFHEKIVGCVLGGAIGDALGAPFKSLWARDLPDSTTLLADFAEYEGFRCSRARTCHQNAIVHRFCP